MGCLLAGCCFGVETNGPLGLSFPANSAASEQQWKRGELPNMRLWSHAVHPTQIYESAACLGIALFCLGFVHGRKRYDGQVFVAFLGLYAIARFLVEFLRDDDRGGLIGLSTSQLIGLGLVAVAVAIHLRRSPKPDPRPAPVADSA
jgi:phosphatidylglycerol:prolipoprotein diacylglycerol transferase